MVHVRYPLLQFINEKMQLVQLDCGNHLLCAPAESSSLKGSALSGELGVDQTLVFVLTLQPSSTDLNMSMSASVHYSTQRVGTTQNCS